MKKVVKGSYQGYYAIPYSKNMFGELIVNIVFDPRELDTTSSTAVKGMPRVFLPESFLEGHLSLDMIAMAKRLAGLQDTAYNMEI